MLVRINLTLERRHCSGGLSRTILVRFLAPFLSRSFSFPHLDDVAVASHNWM